MALPEDQRGPVSSDSHIDRLVQAKQTQLLQARTETIARTEALRVTKPRKDIRAAKRHRVTGDTTIVFGVPVPSTDPAFLAVVRFHILVGTVCVAAGIAAMLSLKRRGRHSTFGTIYYWCLAILVASATGLSMVRWVENYHLFVLGALSLASATVARMALRQRWRNWIRLHITGMGLSYVLMLTAFYVDNGKHLPLWKELPQVAFWVLPAALGAPLVVWALLWHPLERRERTRELN
jgi:hypothetical protein